MICLTLAFGGLGCGRKGDPIPRPRADPRACVVQQIDLRTLQVKLPSADVNGEELVGVEMIRVYFLPIGFVQPSSQDVLAKGEVILERRRPDLPSPGKSLRLDLKEIIRPAGWIVVTSVRVGNVVGAPSDVIPWLDPVI